MNSGRHFLISVAVGVVLAGWTSVGGSTVQLTASWLPITVAVPAWQAAPAVVGYAAVVGVGIDVDHFLVARYNSGTWRAARYCLANPRVVFVDQESIFRPEEIGPFERLLSHVLITGAVVPLLAVVAPVVAFVTAVALYAHVLADLIADVGTYSEVLRDVETSTERL
jgi:hypothetical protein